jgi:hypothetical protein
MFGQVDEISQHVDRSSGASPAKPVPRILQIFKLFQVQRRAQTIRPNDIGIGGERHAGQRNQTNKTSLPRSRLGAQSR